MLADGGRGACGIYTKLVAAPALERVATEGRCLLVISTESRGLKLLADDIVVPAATGFCTETPPHCVSCKGTPGVEDPAPLPSPES